MKTVNEAKTLDSGAIDPARIITQSCSACGYDLDERELAADECSDCGTSLNLKQDIAISVTTFPPMFVVTT